MASRSWMAALSLLAGLATPTIAQEVPRAKPGTTDPPAAPSTTETDTHNVRLSLQIAGLGSKGCEVEIRPAHRACSFRPVTTHVGREGKAVVSFENVRTRSADRDCTFAITIKEAGHAERTIHRGMRLAAPDAPNRAAAQVLTCFLTSPSAIARTTAESGTTSRR